MSEAVNEITLGVVNIVLIALGGLVGTAIRRWLRKHGQDEIVLVVTKAVRWAEQTLPGTKIGKERMKEVENFILAEYPWMKKHWGLVKVVIEAAVKEMKEAK